MGVILHVSRDLQCALWNYVVYRGSYIVSYRILFALKSYVLHWMRYFLRYGVMISGVIMFFTVVNMRLMGSRLTLWLLQRALDLRTQFVPEGWS
jgi:small-conductance mechanosensitive channel